MNNYTQKVDKVGTDEVFPYPIKLEYDDEYIYLTPLWIPETSNVLVSKNKDPETGELSLINLQEANENNSGKQLYIALEYAVPRRNYTNHCTYQYLYETDNWEEFKHPLRGGKFRTNIHLIGNKSGPVILNHTYRFKIPIDTNIFSTRTWLVEDKHKNIQSSFNFFRGTYRYGWAYDFKRTGIYSNTAKIYYQYND